MADVTKDGALSLEEFKTAMHLVVLRRNNIDLPDKLPPSLIPSIPPLAPVPPPPSKPTTGEKHKPASEESLALSNVSPPQADLTSPQKGKDVSKVCTSIICLAILNPEIFVHLVFKVSNAGAY